MEVEARLRICCACLQIFRLNNTKGALLCQALRAVPPRAAVPGCLFPGRLRREAGQVRRDRFELMLQRTFPSTSGTVAGARPGLREEPGPPCPPPCLPPSLPALPRHLPGMGAAAPAGPGRVSAAAPVSERRSPSPARPRRPAHGRAWEREFKQRHLWRLSEEKRRDSLGKDSAPCQAPRARPARDRHCRSSGEGGLESGRNCADRCAAEICQP